MKTRNLLVTLVVAFLWGTAPSFADSPKSCLGFICIGDSITADYFQDATWLVPKKDVSIDRCEKIGCKPENTFYGYTPDIQPQLAKAVSLSYGLEHYTVLTNATIPVLWQYKYECNPSARGIFGERRFIGFTKGSDHQLVVVGLRLINGELKVYRIAKQYPYQHPDELVALAHKLRERYADSILYYNYLSSNAYTDVIKQGKIGWFGRSTMFNPSDLADNAAELVIIDPATRQLLQPTSMPESGEIKPLPAQTPKQCNRSISIE